MPSDGPPPEDFDYGDKRSDGQYENYPTIDEGEVEQAPRDTYIHVEGCGAATTMTGDLPVSVARAPGYYGKTFCSGCDDHVPVEEVEWEDGEDWVVDSDRSADTGSDDIATDGGVDVDGGRQAFLAGDAHYCDICKRQFQTLVELIKHDCEQTGAGTTIRGPDPAAFAEWEASR